jgi:ABC-type transporter lipoprotein component MlaA
MDAAAYRKVDGWMVLWGVVSGIYFAVGLLGPPTSRT